MGHKEQHNVIYHNAQWQRSHFRFAASQFMRSGMEENEIFRQNLMRIREEKDIDAKKLSRMAGLGERAVKDIEEGRSQSPKISTVFRLAKALNVDPGEMLGLPARAGINEKLVKFLSQYDEAGQEQLLAALSLIPIAHESESEAE